VFLVSKFHYSDYNRPVPTCCRLAGDITIVAKALSTLLQKSTATVTENGETTATVAEFGDRRTFLRQCGQALTSWQQVGNFSVYGEVTGKRM